MAFDDFALDLACRSFGLSLEEGNDLFPAIPKIRLTSLVQDHFHDSVFLADTNGTDKARSEFLLAPILAEVRRQRPGGIGLFSGASFDIDPERGLDGACDFLLSASPKQLILQAPVTVVIRQARAENIVAGLGPCVAGMVAAQTFNERSGRSVATVHGAVSTGRAWRFLRLVESSIWVDQREYDLRSLGKIVGILLHCGPSDD